MERHVVRRATLEKLAGLSPFRLGKAQPAGGGSPRDGQPRSFLGRSAVARDSQGAQQTSSLLARLPGAEPRAMRRRLERLRRLAFLRLGAWAQALRALAERVVPAGERAPEPPPKGLPEPPR